MRQSLFWSWLHWHLTLVLTIPRVWSGSGKHEMGKNAFQELNLFEVMEKPGNKQIIFDFEL